MTRVLKIRIIPFPLGTCLSIVEIFLKIASSLRVFIEMSNLSEKVTCRKWRSRIVRESVLAILQARASLRSRND